MPQNRQSLHPQATVDVIVALAQAALGAVQAGEHALTGWDSADCYLR